MGRGENGYELRDYSLLEEKSVLVVDGMKEAFISYWNDELRYMQRRLGMVEIADHDHDTGVTKGKFFPSLLYSLRLIPYEPAALWGATCTARASFMQFRFVSGGVR